MFGKMQSGPGFWPTLYLLKKLCDQGQELRIDLVFQATFLASLPAWGSFTSKNVQVD